MNRDEYGLFNIILAVILIVLVLAVAAEYFGDKQSPQSSKVSKFLINTATANNGCVEDSIFKYCVGK